MRVDNDDEDVDLPVPLWSMLEFHFNPGQARARLSVLCNRRRVDIHLSREAFSPSHREEYLFWLEVAEAIELDEYTVEDVYDWIAKPVLPLFEELGQLETPADTMDTFLFPETHSFILRSAGGKIVAVPMSTDHEAEVIYGVRLDEAYCAPWPSFRPCQLRILQDDPPSPVPSKVEMDDGRVAFLKLMQPGQRGSYVGELEAYGRIRDARLDESLPISWLHGILRDGGIAYGLLLTYVDCERVTLHCAAANPECAPRLRQAWAAQIEGILGRLHDAGLVWGDAKPDNVLVDRGGRAWLVDFGGSYTEGWVPRELAGSVEGDLAGLERIKEFLEGRGPEWSDEIEERAERGEALTGPEAESSRC